MIREESVAERTCAGAGFECDHKGPLTVVVTEMGYHARCLGCQALGPACSGLEIAQEALSVMGAHTESRYR
jgi:hypothetical protein